MNDMNLDEYFAGFPEKMTKIEKIHNDKEIRFKVVVIKLRPPRHKGFDLVREMGSGDISDVMGKKPLSGNLLFVFPERHLAAFEQQSFIDELINNPTAKEIDQVEIITSNPMIVGSFLSEQVRVLTFGDDNG